MEKIDGMVAWQKWCRLCSKNDAYFNVYAKSENHVVDTTLATAIGKYFWVNIKMNDEFSQLICEDCYSLVNSLITFTDRVNKVQSMFCLLQNTKLTDENQLIEVRSRYGLLYEDQGKEKKMEEKEISKEESNYDRNGDDNEEICDNPELDGEDGVEKVIIANIEDEDEEEEEDQQHQQQLEDEEFNFEIANSTESDIKRIKKKQSEVELNNDEYLDYEDDTEEFTKLDVSIEMLENDKSAEEDLEDSDIYKELKYKIKNNDDDDDDDDDDDEDWEQTHTKITRESDDFENSMSHDDLENESKVNQKRKRGRRPKNASDLNSVRKKPRAERNSDGGITSSDDIIECKICTKKYKNPTSYRKHMLEAHKTKPDIPDFKCSTCKKIYPTKNQLALHERTHLSLEDKMDIPCPYCDRKFTKRAIMKQHISGVHQNLKPFICDVCGRALKTLPALNEHKLVHTNECPFECEHCHKRFKNKPRLKAHMDIHAGTQYVCNVCGLKLNTRRTLKMHMLVHNDHKQFKCDFCGTAFKRSKALKNHLILHTGMRPYKCNFCDKSFSNGSNCRSHKKKTHPKELAAEEAMGKKPEPIQVPKLEDLRGKIENPRTVNRTTGGLPLEMRALLIAAEERAKLSENTQPNASDSSTMNLRTYNSQRIVLEDTNDNDVEDDDDDEEDGEQIIYEIIDEI